MQIDEIVNTTIHKLSDAGWRKEKRDELYKEGAAAMRGFLQKDALAQLQEEAQAGFSKAYFNPQKHNIYRECRRSDPQWQVFRRRRA